MQGRSTGEEYRAGFTRHRVHSLIYHLLCSLVEWHKICFLQLLEFFLKGGYRMYGKQKGKFVEKIKDNGNLKGTALKIR